MQHFKTQREGKSPGKRHPSPGSPRSLPIGKTSCFAAEAPLSPTFRNPAFDCGDLPIGCAQKTVPFDAPFAADGDMATVTWSNLMERLKGRKRGVNCPADA